MSCDIHLVLEQKHKGKWIGLREVNHTFEFRKNPESGEWKQHYVFCNARRRNYHLFASLAGVRGAGPAAKGIPEDASELSQMMFEHWGSDGHSHSYCTLNEYIAALAGTEENPAEVFLGADHPAVKYPLLYYFGMYEPEDGEEFRVVFCFDN